MTIIAVIGAGSCDLATEQVAEEVGELLARAGCTVVTGGLDGVMAAASRGAKRGGGVVVGVLPGTAGEDANEWVDLAVATGVGDGRNAIIANTAAGFVAVGGSYGTLSEIAFALKRGKPVAGIGSWQVDPKLRHCDSAAEAVDVVLAAVREVAE